jgi:hypothetical protein
VQLNRETNQEKYMELKEDFQNFKNLGVDVYSVTYDGNKVILKSIKKGTTQCNYSKSLVHIKRQIRNYLHSKPKL